MKRIAVAAVAAAFATLPLLQSCLGPTSEAQVGAAVQTLLAKTIEPYILSGGVGTTTASANCGADTASGTVTLTITSGTLDPTNGTISSQGTVAFSNCVIPVCGSTVTLNGSNASFSITPVNTSTRTSFDFTLLLTLTNQAATGILSGNISFAYRMRAVGSNNSLSSITITEAATPNPLIYGGRTYSATEIGTLADGC